MIWSYSQAIAVRLRAWAVVSVLVGAYLLTSADAFWWAFGLQALVWGAIDGLIAWAGLRSAQKRSRPPEAEAAHLRRLLWLNAGLDVLYIAVGAALIYFSAGQADWLGHGWGVILQGAFLLVFDAVHAYYLPPEPQFPAYPFFAGAEHQPFVLKAAPGSPAVVLVHGFPGTPAEMRAVGEVLHHAGYSVHGLLLPGFGPDVPTLMYRRWPDWVEAVTQAVQTFQREHPQVVLLGYSFGGALSVEAAVRVQPTALVLCAPFVLVQPLWQKMLFWFFAPFLPHALKPYARANFAEPQFQHTLQKFLGGADVTDPALQQAVREITVPSTLLQEVAATGRAVQFAPQVRAPVLVLQGEQDLVSRPANTQKLVQAFGPRARYAPLPTGHQLLEPESAAWPQLQSELLVFLRQPT